MGITSRLPGVYFQTETPPLADKLPRMDIAAFVGFATSGPLDTPVPIEDEVGFREIFGDDLSLAWDEAAGQTHYAYLGQAVRAFFLNGGRRCWIIRVADAERATSNRYLIPGLMQWSPESPDGYFSALAIARSEGSWSDNLTVGTTLLSTPLRAVAFQVSEISPPAQLTQAEVQIGDPSPDTVEAGDFLRLDFDQISTVVFLAVREVEPIYGELNPFDLKLNVRGSAFWFGTDRQVASPPDVETVSVRLLMPENSQMLTQTARWRSPQGTDENHLIFLNIISQNASPTVGSLLEVTFADGSVMLSSVNQVRDATPDEREELSFSPPDVVTVVRGKGLIVLEKAEQRARWDDIRNQGLQPTIGRLAFEMRATDIGRQTFRLDDLGFLKPHPRFLGNLPTDVVRFRSVEEVGPLPEGVRLRESPLWDEVLSPRFPLAVSANEAAVYLPIGLEPLPNNDIFSTALDDPNPETAPVRNGLEEFETALFLDPDLREQRAATLEATVFDKRHVRRAKLEKLHAVFPLEEVTLLSVPDAVHPEWKGVPISSTRFDAPRLKPIDIAAGNRHIVCWTSVNGATKYQLQEAADSQFSDAVKGYQVEANTVTLTHSDRCPDTLYYRVRAERNGEVSPWSNTHIITVPHPVFETCDVTALTGPNLDETSRDSRRYTLQWSLEGVDVEKYTLQEATDPAFDSAVTLYEGADTFFQVVRSPGKVYFYRVRAERTAELGPWSNTVIVQPDAQSVWRVNPVSDYDPRTLVDVHRAMLRLSMVRADILSILTIPRHYRESEALAHKRTMVSILGVGEEKGLSYGALYHPWTLWRTETGTPQPVPPDGSVTGSIAFRANTRGAWIAPANEILEGILALDPLIAAERWAILYDEQVNLIRQEPHGFVLLSEDTLSVDTDLRPINVRRLLILLRRIAQRIGMELVFEPNNEAFRDLVHRTFVGILSDLYSRGAFAGDTPDRAYRVVTDSSVNIPSSLDLGRFIVELRVAPSQPMAFITVRLVQGGGEGLRITEV